MSPISIGESVTWSASNYDWIDDVAKYIADHGFGVYAGDNPKTGNVFAHKLPATPVNAVALIAYYPGQWRMAFGPDPFIESPRFRVEIRNDDDGDGWRLAYGIYRLLGRTIQIQIKGVTYQQFEPVQSPFLLERSGNEWAVFAINFEVWKELSS